MATSPQLRVELDRLPGRPQAESALTSALQRREPFQLLVLVVNRLPLVNERFGYEVGDRILEVYSERLLRELDDDDRLCRWSATALVAFLGTASSERAVPPVEFDETVQLDGGPVHLAMRATSKLYSVDYRTRLDDLIHSIDYFVATELDLA